jgi:transcriptional regulator with XRE-family HTH domain
MGNARKILGDNVKRIRTSHKWTQAQLAEKTDLSVTMIQKIEYGDTAASPETIDKLSEALCCSLSNLYFEATPPKRASRSVGQSQKPRERLTSRPLSEFHLDPETMAKVLPWLLGAIAPVQVAVLFLLSEDERFLEYLPGDTFEEFLGSLKVV